MATQPNPATSAKKPAREQTPLDKALIKWGEKIYKIDSKNRFAEDREWYQAALFDQLKQWITIKNNRWAPIIQNKNKPVPMPVTNHFSKTINANANSLGAAIPEMVAISSDSSNANRRAAEAAENSFPEMDKESGMEEQNPKLAKQTVLWGIGVAKETVDTSENEDMPQLGLQSQDEGTCPSCGWSGNPSQMTPGATPQAGSPRIPDVMAQQPACPQCGAPLEMSQNQEPIIEGMQSFPKGKLCTEIIPIFEVYIPRDCRDPNLAKRLTHRFRRSSSVAKRLYPDVGEFPVDNYREIPQFYVDSLRSLVMSSGDERDLVSLTEIWADWDELDDETQEAIATEWGNVPSSVVGYEGMTRLQAAKKYGIYFIWVGGLVCAKGEGPWDGKKCMTFFVWQKDVASPYPKGQSAELVPLQKRLNRTDSLMELAEMTNSVGKWIIPNTQQNTAKITGSPADILWWDPIGDGKTKPEFYLPSPYGAALVAKRAQIIQDFRDLGYTEGVGTGDAGGVKAFRAIAYLGAKQEENIQTQRFLWEQAHKLRKEKLLIMAQKIWDEARKAKVAGFNGRFGMQQLTGKDLQGEYGIEVVKDSSRPKTSQEKLGALQIATQAGMVNPQDSSVRDFTMNTLGLNEINASDHYHYVKADRDLEKLKQGIMPFESPFQKWDIYLKIIADYTLTEEFEETAPNIQQGILMYAQYLSDKLSAVTKGQPPDPALLQKQLAGAIQNGSQNPLGAAPGAAQPDQIEGAAINQGNQIGGMPQLSA